MFMFKHQLPLKNCKDTCQSHEITQTKGTCMRKKPQNHLYQGQEIPVLNQSISWMPGLILKLKWKWQIILSHLSAKLCDHFPLDYRCFLLFPIYVSIDGEYRIPSLFTLFFRVAKEQLVLLLKTGAKKALSTSALFLILCHYVSPYSQ